MSNFTDVGANCFLGSIYKQKQIGPNPSTERGQTLHINIHPREPKLIYPCGKFVVVKSLVDPSDCFVYRGHQFVTTVAKFSPNGYWVASADIGGKVRIWSWDHPEHLLKLETPVFGGPVLDLDWDSESKKITVVGESSGLQAKCFTWDTGNSVGELVGHAKRIRSVSYKPSRPFRIFTGSEDFQTAIYEGPPFKLGHMNKVHTNFVNCVRYSPNGQHAISVGTDKKIQLYDGATGQPTKDISNAHDGGIYSASFSPDSKKFATASADKTIKVWDTESLALLQTLKVSAAPQIADMQVAVLWAPSHIVSVSLNGNINLFDPATPDPVRVLQANQVSISALCLHKPTMSILSGSVDGVVCHRNLAALDSVDAIRFTGKDNKNISGAAHAGKVVGVVVTATGDVISAGWDDKLRFADLGSKAYHSEVALNGQPCAISTAGDLLLVVTNAELALFRGPTKVATKPVAALGYSPTSGAIFEGHEVSVGGDDNKVHVYRLEAEGSGFAFQDVTVLPGASAVSALAYSPTGDKIAVGYLGRQIEVFDRSSWEPLVQGRWVNHTSRITTVAWSPDGSKLASGSLDENIFIWALSKITKNFQLSFTHTGGVSAVEWVDESSLASSGNDNCVVTWKVPSEL